MSTATLPAPIATPLMTGAEFLARHGDESGVELVLGRVVMSPMPGGKHGTVCNMAAYILTRFVLESGLGRVLCNDTFLRTRTDPESYRGADVCFLSYLRLPKDQEVPDGPIPVPEIVIEVKSPADRVNRLAAKATEYLEAGVLAVVLLIPETKEASLFRLDELPTRLAAGDILTIPDVLPGFSTPVGAFFA
ncbi:MAG: Uma2 family endonuclease [Gemmataceae bacterium]